MNDEQALPPLPAAFDEAMAAYVEIVWQRARTWSPKPGEEVGSYEPMRAAYMNVLKAIDDHVRAQVDPLRTDIANYVRIASEEAAKVDGLFRDLELRDAILDKYRADAKRWRYVRKQLTWAPGDDDGDGELKLVMWLRMAYPDISGTLTDESVPLQFDAAVDAAIARSKG